MPEPITNARAAAGAALLEWYDRHHRDLPWRVGPADRARGVWPDPYRVWLSEIMLQQTTVAAVKAYFHAFTDRWPDVHALAAAPTEAVMGAWAGLGYYARARNLLKCARTVSADLGGLFPDTEEGLRALPGIGAYTAAAIAAIAFDRKAVVVDGNVERVVARLNAVEAPLPGSKAVLREHAAALTPDRRPGDHAQAVMDLGATICTPRRPACALCPLRGGCAAQAAGIAERLPAKTPKPAKPVRLGIAWVLAAPGGRIVTTVRPDGGLLGGMLALPSTDWAETPPDPEPPVPLPAQPLSRLAGDWTSLGEVRHTFTHFHLRLEVRAARSGGPVAEALALDEAAARMPTVFAKACRLAEAYVRSG